VKYLLICGFLWRARAWLQSDSKSLRLHLNADRFLTETEPSGDDTAA
jgi:hypothetical protein